MKKIFAIFLTILTLFTITGCGCQNKNNTNSNINNKTTNNKTEEVEVFENIDGKTITKAQTANETFLYLVYDDSYSSRILKKHIEKIAKKYKYTIYLYDYKTRLEELTEKNIKSIKKEQEKFNNEYCKEKEFDTTGLTKSEIKELEDDLLITKKDNIYYEYECSNAIAKEKNKDYEYSNDDSEPIFECTTCERIKEQILSEAHSDTSTNLIFVNNGIIASEIGDYVELEVALLNDKTEQEEILNKKYQGLEKWFKQIDEYINKTED